MSHESRDFLEIHMLGRSPGIQRVKELVRRAAPSSLPVIVEGETGTGKEVAAQALHALSGRRGRLVAVNVCAYSDAMLEDALFGHARGAFTGAHSDEPGLLDEAKDGTLFLDEIGALSLVQQAKLLRVLETRTWRRLGESRERAGNFRVVAATNQPLAQLVAQRQFRGDLAFRLRGIELPLPALRERGSDVLRLAVHFARGAKQGGPADARIDSSALRTLRSWSWPGNVRELRTVVEAATLMSADGRLSREHVEGFITGRAHSRPTLDLERAALVAALEEARGDPVRAAEIEGVSRATIFRRARAHGVSVATFRHVSPEAQR